MKREWHINMLSSMLFSLCAVLAVTTTIGFGRSSHWYQQWKGLDKDYYNLSLDFGYASTTVQRQFQDITLLEEELQVMTKRADQVASLSALAFLLTPDEIHQYMDQIPEGNPFKGEWYLTSRFGSGKGYRGIPRQGHLGQDMVVIGGDWYISPVGNGRVIDIGISEYEGKWILIEHTDRVRTKYMHLEKIYYEALPGEEVTTETNIGWMGSTGNSDGAHLHVEILIFDGESWKNIDPYPYLEGERNVQSN